MALTISDVEVVKKRVRKMAAGKVLAGGSADVCLELGSVGGAPVRIAGGYGPLDDAPRPVAQDWLIWVLDGHVEVHTPDGNVTDVRSGESTVLAQGTLCRVVFPQLTIYLSAKAGSR